MNERGRSLVETLATCGIVMVLVAVAAPTLKAYTEEAQILGVGRLFKAEFLKARSVAVRSGVQTAIRFESLSDGVGFSVYSDANRNGVLSSEIATGKDRRIAGPFRLGGGSSGVQVAILPRTPAPPPDRGTLDTSDPIKFGRSNMVSFSSLGTATPGTLYLAGRRLQGAVRVNGATARVRFMVCRGGTWTEKP